MSQQAQWVVNNFTKVLRGEMEATDFYKAARKKLSTKKNVGFSLRDTLSSLLQELNDDIPFHSLLSFILHKDIPLFSVSYQVLMVLCEHYIANDVLQHEIEANIQRYIEATDDVDVRKLIKVAQKLDFQPKEKDLLKLMRRITDSTLRDDKKALVTLVEWTPTVEWDFKLMIHTLIDNNLPEHATRIATIVLTSHENESIDVVSSLVEKGEVSVVGSFITCNHNVC